jgi:hypothetical protein
MFNKLQYRRLDLMACQKRNIASFASGYIHNTIIWNKEGEKGTITLRPSSVHILSCLTRTYVLVSTWHKVTLIL